MSDKMTIAQALRRVKKIKGLLYEHMSRAQECASYMEDKKPEFDFDEEVSAMSSLTNEMLNLQAKIAVANSNAIISNDGTECSLTMAIRILEELKGQIKFYSGLTLRHGIEKQKEQMWDENADKFVTKVEEINYISAMTERQRADKIRSLNDQFEALNNAVEDANHVTLV